MILLDGKKNSQKIKDEIKVKVKQLIKEKQRLPQLVVIIVGDDYPSQIYVKNKIRACEECGIKGQVINFPENAKQNEIIATIDQLNQDITVDGILVQLPLVKHLNEFEILNRIAINKDVDGLTNISAGKLLQGDKSAIIPCTVKGIITLLDVYKLPIHGQDITIINNSNIVGKPLAMLLSNLGATVSIAHKDTKNLSSYLKSSDIIITAAGVYNLFDAQMVKDDVIIIDVAINLTKDKKLVGDINFNAIKSKTKAITPVPGGVGPMTIAMLLDNLMILYHNKKSQLN
ncbi:MAG: bifunctional 5,10-methylenetetrahydrofolate dehydrogenase/5,10-methenyltetrahydrofolate cyclohydrolase [Spiroplasma sp.]|nr:bifunctional 5,10-methylenetetrahydrofolate dehydrogenase/5,10-methenyltetrahydrofolate cyclohydrolase [Spiroplasma sp.]